MEMSVIRRATIDLPSLRISDANGMLTPDTCR
jgi:hypothetical protein